MLVEPKKPLLNCPMKQDSFESSGSSIHEPVPYCISCPGEIYQCLTKGHCTTSLGARIISNTPILFFLDSSSLYNASCVCKLWWAELYSFHTLKFFLEIPLPLYRHQLNPQEKIIISPIHSPGATIEHSPPRVLLTSTTRSAVWRLALVGEYESIDLNFYHQLQKTGPTGKHVVLDSYTYNETVVSANVPGSELDTSTPLLPTTFCVTHNPLENADVYSDLHTAQTTSSYYGLIQRDIARTFPGRPLFQYTDHGDWGLGQISLWRMLNYIANKTHLGYCQGMNFVAAIFLEIFNGHEEDSIRCFNALLRRNDIGQLYEPSLKLAQAYCVYLDMLVSHYLPLIHSHFKLLNLTAMTYGLHWIITLLSYDMPLKSLVIIWDQLILSGPAIMFQVILGLLFRTQSTLIGSSFECCLKTLKSLTPNAFLTVQDIISFIHQFPLPEDITQHAKKLLHSNILHNERNSTDMDSSDIVHNTYQFKIHKEEVIHIRSGFPFQLFSACRRTENYPSI